MDMSELTEGDLGSQEPQGRDSKGTCTPLDNEGSQTQNLE